jgi:hypothetical protein
MGLIEELQKEANDTDFRCTFCNQGSCICEIEVVGEPDGI